MLTLCLLGVIFFAFLVVLILVFMPLTPHIQLTEKQSEGDRLQWRKIDRQTDRRVSTRHAGRFLSCGVIIYHWSARWVRPSAVSVRRDGPPSRWPRSNRWSRSGGGAERSDICHPQQPLSHT